MQFDTLQDWFIRHPVFSNIFVTIGILILSYISYLITRHYVIKTINKIVLKTKTRFDDILLKEKLLSRFSYIAPLIVFYTFSPQLGVAENMIRKISSALIYFFILLTIGTLLSALNEIYQTRKISTGRPIKGYIQVSKLIIYIIGGIIIISNLLDRSPLVILSGFGAMTAVILLIFRDTILSFVASLQITSNDLVRVGDWIEIPTFGADGDVVDIALHTVTIQNWDKTFTVIPTHKLIDQTFKNWRGMKLSGGRRIKRSFYLDISTIKFCDTQMIERYKQINHVARYLEKKETQGKQIVRIDPTRNQTVMYQDCLTNAGIFRFYVDAYLRSHPKIRQDMTFLVRELQPGPQGLPIEIYVFTNDTIWANYESIQAEIFDHILAMVPYFDLAVFQHPAGKDFNRLALQNTPEFSGETPV